MQENLTMSSQLQNVTDLELPPVTRGYRTGWAYAVVDGVKRRMYTTRHETAPYDKHAADVRAAFKEGWGSVVPKGENSCQ